MPRRAGTTTLPHFMLALLLAGSGCSMSPALLVWNKRVPAAKPPSAQVLAAAEPAAPTIRLAASEEPEPVPAPAPARPSDKRPQALPSIAVEPRVQPVTLPAVLEIVDASNPAVNAARYQMLAAMAQVERSQTLWLPSIRGGLNYNKHEGRIQDVAGNNIETSRGAFYQGLGAGAVGAGSPAVPGLYANFHLSDAIFQPKIAAHAAAARQANAEAVTNDMLLQTAQAYLELLRAYQERAIAEEVLAFAQKLADVTAAYAHTGQGLAADADRARTEFALRRNDVLRAEEAVRVASARLAQLVRMDPCVLLAPQEPTVLPLDLVCEASCCELVCEGLTNRPEVRENRQLVSEAVRRLQREQYAPFIPSVLLGASYGNFGAGLGGAVGNYGDRFDGDAFAWWELRNFGAGEAAARKEMNARIELAQWRQLQMLDQIAREVAEAHAQVTMRKQQVETARESIGFARDSYERNLVRIENAQGLPLEALQSIQAIGQAKREYLRSVTDYNLAQFSLCRALGWPEGPLDRPVEP